MRSLKDTAKAAKKHMTSTELKNFDPILKGNMKDLKEAELKRRISFSKKALTKSSSKKTAAKSADKIKVLKNLLSRMEKHLVKLKGKVPSGEDKDFIHTNSVESASAKLASRKNSSLAISKQAPVEAKHWEKTPIKRVAGFQGAQTRQRQGARDKKGADTSEV